MVKFFRINFYRTIDFVNLRKLLFILYFIINVKHKPNYQFAFLPAKIYPIKINLK